MILTRSDAKRRARELVAGNLSQVLITSTLFLALLALIFFLSYRLTGYTREELQRYVQYMSSGDTQRAVEYLLSRSPGSKENLVDTLLNMVSIILSAGYLLYLINNAHGTEPVTANLLDGFGLWWRILILNLLTGVLIFLWSLLLVIPGIVAAYKYRMATYLLLTRPEYSLTDCLRESKDMMDGHKWEMFVLDLSFLGWLLLGMVPILGWLLYIWILPYMQTTSILFYDQFSGRTASQQEEPLSF